MTTKKTFKKSHTSPFTMKSITHVSIKPQIPFTIHPIKTPPSHSSLSHHKLLKTQILALSSSSHSQVNPISSTTKEAQQLGKSSTYNVEFKTLGGCKLGVSRYPNFDYDANGGVGIGSGIDHDSNGKIFVSFDVDKLYIPPLTSGTTKFLGLPLPLFLRIDIVPQIFEGSIDKQSGKVDLEFKAQFWFSAGGFYKAPPLLVQTVLTSEESVGKLRKGKGQRMDNNGNCNLVGVAMVDPINDMFMNTFLSLPSECLAILNATILIQQ